MGDGLFKRGHIWFAWINGHRVSTGLRDKQAATKKRDELERRAVDPAYALGREATGQTIFDNYARSRRRLGRSAGTMHHVETKMGNLLRLLPVKCDDWNLAEFEKYVDDRLKEGVRRTTIKKELRVALAALRHARKHHLFDRAPEDIIPELGDDYRPRTRFLTPWELVALVSALEEENEPHRGAHIVFIAATGARWGESLRAHVEDVDFKTLTVHLRGTKTKTSTRDVPMVGPARSLLRWAVDRAFEPKCFQPWPNVRRSLLSACKRAGIAPVSPNDLRRTFSTWLQQAGATNDLIAKVMGHTSSRMVERVYGKLPAADVARLLRERVGGGLSDEGVRDGEGESATESATGDSLPGGSGVGAGPGRGRSGGGRRSGASDAPASGHDHPESADGTGRAKASSEHPEPGPSALKNTGLLMGSKQVFSGRSEGTSVITEKAVSPEKNQAFRGAQRQNRTADTGIFNPPESATNADESRNSGAGWVAGGRARAMADMGVVPSTTADVETWLLHGADEWAPVQGPCQACPMPWGLHTSSMKRRCRGDDPPLGIPSPSVALDLARFARDAAWDAAEKAVRRELIARRRYLPQFVGAVRT